MLFLHLIIILDWAMHHLALFSYFKNRFPFNFDFIKNTKIVKNSMFIGFLNLTFRPMYDIMYLYIRKEKFLCEFFISRAIKKN